MTNTDETRTRLKDASDELITAQMRRRLLEGASILTRMVRRKSSDLLRAHLNEDDTAQATRDVSAIVIAAHRTMEMKHKLDGIAGSADALTREGVARLLELNDAQIAEFFRSRGAPAQVAPDSDAGPGSDPLSVARARS
ncbi:MAG: hypothetical protein ABL957_11650 [Parvularculaceae bacterium]